METTLEQNLIGRKLLNDVQVVTALHGVWLRDAADYMDDFSDASVQDIFTDFCHHHWENFAVKIQEAFAFSAPEGTGTPTEEYERAYQWLIEHLAMDTVNCLAVVLYLLGEEKGKRTINEEMGHP